MSHPPSTIQTDDPPRAAHGAEAQYRQALDEGRFLIQQCDDCQQHIFYPRMICPHCGHGTLHWREPSGAGTVYSTTVVRRKAEAGGDYNVALIDLPEGVRLMSRVLGVAPDTVHIGMPVRARIERVGEQGLLTFVPQGQPA